MNKGLIVACFLVALGAYASFAQETKRSYEIVKTGSVEHLNQYHQALMEKDLDPHRLIEEDRIIQFSSGVEIRLYSAKRLEAEYGRFRDHQLLNRMGDELIYPWKWVLGEDGKIHDKRIHAADDN